MNYATDSCERGGGTIRELVIWSGVPDAPRRIIYDPPVEVSPDDVSVTLPLRQPKPKGLTSHDEGFVESRELSAKAQRVVDTKLTGHRGDPSPG
jgi:hypothetical protein